MVSEWMEHGTLMDFVTACPGTNRLKLVSTYPRIRTSDQLLQLADVTRGLKYLHDWPSVHADLKSVSIHIQYSTLADDGHEEQHFD